VLSSNGLARATVVGSPKGGFTDCQPSQFRFRTCLQDGVKEATRRHHGVSGGLDAHDLTGQHLQRRSSRVDNFEVRQVGMQVQVRNTAQHMLPIFGGDVEPCRLSEIRGCRS
jgi:hypothetical protein